jgi:STE24 endopeptidase
MQILILIMIMGLYAYDGLGPIVPTPLDGAALWAVTLGPYALILALVLGGCLATERTLQRRPTRAKRWLWWLDMGISASHAMTLLVFMAGIYLFGALDALRAFTEPFTLPADLLILIPPLLTLTATWWAYYPIDRILRGASLMRELEEGAPVEPILRRGHYVISQVRHQLLLMLAPLVLLMAWIHAVDYWVAPLGYSPLAMNIITFAGSLTVFSLAPLMIRYIWDTEPMPAGPTRDRLLALCDQYRVRVRQLLLWNTYGAMVNGAVMGLIGRPRYILLTDGLLQAMDDDQVEAVMAHELGHVKHHHLGWDLRPKSCFFTCVTIPG